MLAAYNVCVYVYMYIYDVCSFGGVSRGPMRLISGPYQMSLGCNEKAALVLMHNKVNELLHYHSVQTTPVGTSALHWFVCVCV